MEELKPVVDKVNRQAQDLIRAGLGFDSLLVKQLSDTDKQWQELKSDAATQDAEIERALQLVDEMQQILKETDHAVTVTENKVNELPAIGSDVDTINKQLEDIKVCEIVLFMCWVFRVQDTL